MFIAPPETTRQRPCRPEPRRSPPRSPVAGRPAGWTGRAAAPPRPGCARCARSRRRSGPWSRCCASTPSPAPRPGLDAPGRSAAARARRRDRHRADRRPARPRRLRRAPGRGARTACWPACRPARSRCPKASFPMPGEGRPAQRLGAQTVVAATVRAISCSAGSSCWAGTSPKAMGEARDQRRAQPACASATTCSAKARAATPTRSATTPPMRRRSRTSRRPGRRRALPTPTASRSSSARCSRATRWRSAERVFAELLPRACGRWWTRRPRRPQPHHRRRGERPPGTLARRLRGAGRAHRASASEMARFRPRHPGLPDAFARRGRGSGAHRAHAGPALHGAARQGRLLGRRGQARPGARPGRLSGVHAQAPHRHRLPRLRAPCSRTRT